jgi:hypothetical protein
VGWQLPRVYEQLALRETQLAPLFAIRRPGVYLSQSDLIRSHVLDHFPCECSQVYRITYTPPREGRHRAGVC